VYPIYVLYQLDCILLVQIWTSPLLQDVRTWMQINTIECNTITKSSILTEAQNGFR